MSELSSSDYELLQASLEETAREIARLRAANTDLLAACRSALQTLQEENDGARASDPDCDPWRDQIESLLAAIAML